MTSATCPKCGGDVGRTGARGPVGTYCGPWCRRAAEFELRRMQRRLERAEVEFEVKRRRVEQLAAGVVHAYSDHQRKLARVEFEQAERLVAELEARMRLLLAGGADIVAS
jgi:hypothetical protein